MRKQSLCPSNGLAVRSGVVVQLLLCAVRCSMLVLGAVCSDVRCAVCCVGCTVLECCDVVQPRLAHRLFLLQAPLT